MAIESTSWENGLRVPNGFVLQKLAMVLNTTVSHLLGEKEASESLNANAINSPVANIKGTVNASKFVNASEKVIIFEYELEGKPARLIFPQDTPGDVIAQSIQAARNGR
ncbi:MAG: hypothetical protein LBJ36_03165 [Synergistaceae bacterium]|nr:hypothetical protein [Synergistaceae bacterium]